MQTKPWECRVQGIAILTWAAPKWPAQCMLHPAEIALVTSLMTSKIRTKNSCELPAKAQKAPVRPKPYTLLSGYWGLSNTQVCQTHCYAVPFHCKVLSFMSLHNQLPLIFLDCTSMLPSPRSLTWPPSQSASLTASFSILVLVGVLPTPTVSVMMLFVALLVLLYVS